MGDSLYSVQSDSGVSTYSFTDIHPIIGDNVYRLQQNGLTGNISYSSNVSVGYSNSGPSGELLLYPNPTKTTMTANILSSAPVGSAHTANIYDSMGNLVKHEAISGATWTEDVSSYRRGIYFVQVKDNNGNIVAQSKFVKAD